jgi:hypothetical protein
MRERSGSARFFAKVPGMGPPGGDRPPRRSAFCSPCRQFLPHSRSSHALVQSHDDGLFASGIGGMPMNSGLTSALSEFTKRSGFSKNPLAEPSNEPPLHPSELSLIARARLRLGKVVPFAFVRFLVIFFIGVVATLVWQSHGDAARQTITNWSPHLGWLAPAAPPPVDASSDRLKAASLALASVRQSVDKLAAEIARLQVAEQRAPEKTSAPPPTPAGGPPRKPASPTQPSSRAPPAR